MHTDIDDCLPNPCQNNATCTDLVNDYQCNCVSGFNGTTCENSKNFVFIFFDNQKLVYSIHDKKVGLNLKITEY